MAMAIGVGACTMPQTQRQTQSGSKTGPAEAADAGAPKQPASADKAFVSGGRIDMRLEGGSYTVRSAADDHVRVTLGGNTGNARVELTTSGTDANLAVKDTPHGNFQATIEVPKTTDLIINLTGGDLKVDAISGNKDIESGAGDTEIAVGDPDEYSSVDASVKAGDIQADVFGGSRSGIFQHFTWSGHGRYRLRANLGAGNLKLRRT